jgi:hypothetical protein
MAMDKVLKKKWVKALRSGRYRQGIDYLQCGEGNNCCLGVLCRVARVKAEPSYCGTKSFDGDESHLTDKLLKKFKITAKQQNKLIDMNDSQGKTFKEIADYIEKKL